MDRYKGRSAEICAVDNQCVDPLNLHEFTYNKGKCRYNRFVVLHFIDQTLRVRLTVTDEYSQSA
jgi:hypothetical protein